MTDRTEQAEIEELAELLVRFYINGTLKDTVHANEYRRRDKAILDAGYTRSNSPDTVKLDSALEQDIKWCIDRINESALHIEVVGDKTCFKQEVILHLNVLRRTVDCLKRFGTVKVPPPVKLVECMREEYFKNYREISKTDEVLIILYGNAIHQLLTGGE